MIEFIKGLYTGDTLSDVLMTIILIIGGTFGLLLLMILVGSIVRC